MVTVFKCRHHKINESLIVRKMVFRVIDQVRHKLGCAVTEESQIFEILDLRSRKIFLCSVNKGANQLCKSAVQLLYS